MSYYQTQPYGSYAAQHSQIQPQPQQQQPYGTTAYTNVTPYTPYQAPPGASPAPYPIYSTPPVRQPGISTDTPPPGEGVTRVAAPEFPDVNPQVASHTLGRLISSELQHAGFDSAQSGCLELLELEAVGCAYCIPRLELCS